MLETLRHAALRGRAAFRRLPVWELIIRNFDTIRHYLVYTYLAVRIVQIFQYIYSDR